MRYLLIFLILGALAAGAIFWAFDEKESDEAVNMNEASEGQLFTLAQKKASNGNCPKAIALYEKLLSKDAEHVSAIEFMATCQIRLKKYKKAYENYKKVHELQPNDRYLKKLNYLSKKIKKHD